MQKLSKITILAAAGIALTAAIPAAPGSAQDSLTFTSWGGAYSDSQRKAYHEPFTKETGIQILEDEWSGDIAQIRVQVETKNYKWHVIDVETDHVLAGCDEGILEVLDWDLLGGKDRFVAGASNDCGAGTISWSTIYAYDGDVLSEGNRPTTANDFFDVKKWPGKRGLWRSPKHNLEFALIADGVPTDKVYEVLSTDEGLDRAFKKLDSIKSDILWWEAGAQPPQLLADKEVVMTTAWNGRIFNAVVNEGKNFMMVWDGQGIDFDWWVIPKGHPDKATAMKFIEYGMRPDVQKNQSKYISYGPTVKATVPLIPEGILKDLPAAPENTKNYYVVNAGWWADRREELMERINSWLAQ